jgi:LCP family protein required for cell wall assembly
MRLITKKQAKKIKANYLKWGSKALAGAAALSYLMAVYFVLKIAIIPTKYLVLILPVTLAAVAGLVYGLIKDNAKNARKSVALGATSAIVTGLCVYAAMLGASAASFIGSLQQGEYTEVEYALDEGAVSTAVLRSSYLALLQDNYSTFYKSSRVLDTFKIRVKNASAAKAVDTTKPFVVYISGIDTYGDVSAVSRSDVNILAVVNPQTKKILLVNTPRDYYVQLNGTTGVRDKLTHAGIYGVDVSRKTLQDLYGVNIDNYLRINFTSLKTIVDRLGGVEVISDYSFKSGKYNFTKGPNKLDGDAALEFSRNRYAFEDGDRQRGKNQQLVIEAIIKRATGADVVVYYQSILSSLTGTFQTDASRAQTSALIKQQLNSLGDWKVESISVDGTGKTAPTHTMGAQPLYVMEPSIDTVNAAKAKIAEYLVQK